jgi:phage terminase large subunit-like protein
LYPPAAEDLDAAECGIIVAGLEVVKGMPVHGYVLADHSMQGSPKAWATAVIRAYNGSLADLIVAEKNQGGEMVRHTIHSVDPTVPVKLVTATRNKQTRAEPVSAQYERGFIHHVGEFPKLEDQLCLWEPGDRSPDRMDALVWAMSELMGSGAQKGAWGGR